LVALTAIVVGIYASMVVPRALRRRRLLSAPFSPSQRAILERSVRFYRGLDSAGRARFEQNVALALADYRFEPVGGASVTDEIRLLTAAAAATLAHGADRWPFRGQRTVLIYPNHFDSTYEVGASNDIAGMVHAQGPIVLSERALRDGYRRERDGSNVALHELAHELDLDDGHADGVPIGLAGRAFEPWVALMRDRRRDAARHRSVLRHYAGTNTAETFAVATELFFERPGRLAEKDPALFAALSGYYGLDPREIVEGEPARRERIG
jgi:MtfA peptidase